MEHNDADSNCRIQLKRGQTTGIANTGTRWRYKTTALLCFKAGLVRTTEHGPAFRILATCWTFGNARLDLRVLLLVKRYRQGFSSS